MIYKRHNGYLRTVPMCFCLFRAYNSLNKSFTKEATMKCKQKIMQSKTSSRITLFGFVPEIHHFWHQKAYDKCVYMTRHLKIHWTLTFMLKILKISIFRYYVLFKEKIYIFQDDCHRSRIIKKKSMLYNLITCSLISP